MHGQGMILGGCPRWRRGDNLAAFLYGALPSGMGLAQHPILLGNLGEVSK